MKKIGIIGEDPNDTISIINLLKQKYPSLKYKILLKNLNGDHLEAEKTFRTIKFEFNLFKPDYVIFTRDADCLESEYNKLKEVFDWFKKLNSVVENRGLLLTHIYELEALILADIATFNKLYKSNISYKKNPMFEKQPKEFLIRKTRNLPKTYAVSHCPEIFKELSFDTVVNNCAYFKTFNDSFSKKINPQKKL